MCRWKGYIVVEPRDHRIKSPLGSMSRVPFFGALFKIGYFLKSFYCLLVTLLAAVYTSYSGIPVWGQCPVLCIRCTCRAKFCMSDSHMRSTILYTYNMSHNCVK